MGIVVHENSWVTLIEANNYLSDKIDSTVWTTDPSLNSNYLIEAFRILYACNEYSIPKTSTNQNVKDAQCELAFWLKQNYAEYKRRSALQAQGVKEFEIDNFREIYEKGTVILPSIVTGLLDDFEEGSDGFATIRRPINY